MLTELLLSLVCASLTVVGPWLIMVHVKLAVIAAQMVSMNRNVEQLTESYRVTLEQLNQLSSVVKVHEVRLEMLQEDYK